LFLFAVFDEAVIILTNSSASFQSFAAIALFIISFSANNST